MRARDIRTGALAKALRLTRSELIRAIERGEIPAADSVTAGGHRRWRPERAAAVVRQAGRRVPRAWGQGKKGSKQ